MKTFSKKPAEQNYHRIDCPLCGEDSFSSVWRKVEIPFVRCVNCGLVFQNPQPAAEELARRYDGEYFEYEIENEDSFYDLMKLGLNDVGFFDIERSILDSSLKEGRQPSFLDVGCATGKLIFSMQERGWKVRGVEVCDSSARYGIEKRGLDIHIGPLETAEIQGSSQDAVHCSHLIEHLTDPDAFVAEVVRILRPGGIFIIVTPDISGFQSRLFGADWRSAIADHMFLFSRKSLSALMQKHCLNIQKISSWGGLAAGTAPKWLKKTADRLVKPLGAGDVVCIMGMKTS